jgi:glucose-1-phosphate cytidylyltransferase
VPLPSPFGVLDVGDDGRVRRFTEKPRLEDHWINAGFLVLDELAIHGLWWREDLEGETLPLMAEHGGGVYAYRHQGFWRSLDTWKDAMELDALCEDGDPPWRMAR